MYPRQTLEAFDHFLAARGLYLEAVVIGGAALELLGVISRPTKDCDILHPSLPAAILAAAREFAQTQRDCVALAPSKDELTEAKPWVQQQDSNSDWPTHVEAVFADLARRLGHVQP